MGNLPLFGLIDQIHGGTPGFQGRKRDESPSTKKLPKWMSVCGW